MDDAPQLLEYETQSVSFVPHDTKWIPTSARFVAIGVYPLNSTGALAVYSLKQGKLETLAMHEKLQGLKCGTFGASAMAERHLATGDYRGVLSVWDLETADVPLYSVQAHESIVNAIDGCGRQSSSCGAPELVTGGRDGFMRVWDTRVAKSVATLASGDQDGAQECWTVCFGNARSGSDRCVVGGYDNGDVKMFDLRTNSIRWETKCHSGVVNVQFDGDDCAPVYFWQGRFLPQNRDLLMTCGGNGGLNLYKYHTSLSKEATKADRRQYGTSGTVELLNSWVVSTRPFVSMDWSSDREGLCTFGCLDQTVRVYVVTGTNEC
uniref:Uncharacterized protein n=1 Tax=Peronospora matthiolae TaxID=2874970 RepID=A0AAV1TE93_9STRA